AVARAARRGNREPGGMGLSFVCRKTGTATNSRLWNWLAVPGLPRADTPPLAPPIFIPTDEVLPHNATDLCVSASRRGKTRPLSKMPDSCVCRKTGTATNSRLWNWLAVPGLPTADTPPLAPPIFIPTDEVLPHNATDLCVSASLRGKTRPVWSRLPREWARLLDGGTRMTPSPASDLDRSWVVEASAGTGKTTALVDRMVEVIAAGTPVETIVAVTFTHAAAGNMKLRVRHQLERRRAREANAAVQNRLAEAARSLDRAFIGTIHAFCAQLLRRRPVEARIDPDFQELAQADALRVFARVFRRWTEQRLSTPSPALSRAFARLAWRAERDGGGPLDELRKAAWNLAEWRDFDAPWDKRPFAPDAHMAALIHTAEATLLIPSRNGRAQEDFRPLREFVLRVERAREAGRVDTAVLESELLRLPNEMRWVRGRDALYAGWEELKLAIEAFRQPADADLAAHLRDELWEVVELYQQEKQRSGQLDFLDLLLSARDLLRHHGARADLARVYQRIFVDEFQDTDPLQAEILRLLAARDPTERDWRQARPAPGKLYVVGDPKQSIYRFRRADARLFHRICQGLRGDGVGARALTVSTRSTLAIQSFVNAAFEHTIENYLPLEGGVSGPEAQPGIVALPMPYPYGTRNLSNVRIDACSPNAVAAFIQWLCAESGWKVRDRATGTWVDVRPEHVCILFRRFTNYGTDLTQEYVRCLEARGIAHLLVGSKSFHRREEVGTLRTALRAVEWPDDELSVFAVLRGSLFAVLDGALLRFKNAYGRFHPMMELPDEIDAEFTPI